MAGLGLVFMSGGPVSVVQVGVIVAGVLLGAAAFARCTKRLDQVER